jgi:HSP90 family molecular chaperone
LNSLYSRGLLTKRIVKMLDEESKRNEAGYLAWYNDFHMFLKEGLASDQENSDLILQLVRYNVNFTENLITLEQYIEKLKPGQDKIYYILAPTREAALSSPFMESFKNSGRRIIMYFISELIMVYKT